MINHTIVKNLIIPACKIIGVVQLLSHIWLFAHVLQHTRLPCPSVSQTLLKFMPIESMMPFNHLTLCHPLLLFPSFFPSTRVFSNEYSGLISFRIDWFELLAVHGTLKSLLQHHSSKASDLSYYEHYIARKSTQLKGALWNSRTSFGESEPYLGWKDTMIESICPYKCPLNK